jgi:hypothetical protein
MEVAWVHIIDWLAYEDDIYLSLAGRESGEADGTVHYVMRSNRKWWCLPRRQLQNPSKQPRFCAKKALPPISRFLGNRNKGAHCRRNLPRPEGCEIIDIIREDERRGAVRRAVFTGVSGSAGALLISRGPPTAERTTSLIIAGNR